jgi:hypothetical protein
MMITRIAMLLCIACILQVCTPVRVVSTRQNPDVVMDSYRTFNFLDVNFKNEQMGETNQQGIQLLKDALVRELTEKGYRQADNPDLGVNIGIVTEDKVQTRKTDIRDAPVYIGQRRYSWKSEEVEVGRYRLGTVTIDIVDMQKNDPVWEGVVQGTLTDNPGKQKIELMRE